jgi:hypothetical protein
VVLAHKAPSQFSEVDDDAYRRWLVMAAPLVFIASAASAQGSALTAKQAMPFKGTWVIDMTEPAEFKSTQTVRIWEGNGSVAASVQGGKSPTIEVTGIMKTETCWCSRSVATALTRCSKTALRFGQYIH